MGGGRSADGGGGGCEYAGGVEKVECVLAEVGREEGEAAERTQKGCSGPPEKVAMG